MNRFGFLMVMIASFLFSACGSMSVERRLSSNPNTNGIRVQIPQPHRVIAVFKDEAGKVITRETISALPSVDEHYDLDFLGAVFTKRGLNVEFQNGMLKTYSFASTASLDEGLSSTATAIQQSAEAFKALEASREKPVVADPLDDANASLQKEILNRLLEANLRALENGEPLPFPEIIGVD